LKSISIIFTRGLDQGRFNFHDRQCVASQRLSWTYWRSRRLRRPWFYRHENFQFAYLLTKQEPNTIKCQKKSIEAMQIITLRLSMCWSSFVCCGASLSPSRSHYRCFRVSWCRIWCSQGRLRCFLRSCRWHVHAPEFELKLCNKLVKSCLLITLCFQHAVLSFQVVNVLLVWIVLASHKLDVLSRLLKDLCTTRLQHRKLAFATKALFIPTYFLIYLFALQRRHGIAKWCEAVLDVLKLWKKINSCTVGHKADYLHLVVCALARYGELSSRPKVNNIFLDGKHFHDGA
jgi:hypothetical protein